MAYKVLFDGNGSGLIQVVGHGAYVPLEKYQSLASERDDLAAQLVAVKEVGGTGQSPCAKFCESVALKKDFDQLREHADKMKVERDALAAQIEGCDKKIFELTCFRIDVLRCLKTIAFEHNHQDVAKYKNLAFSLMKSIESNESIIDMQAEAGRAGFVAGADALEVAQILGSDFDVETSANEYAGTVRQGGE